MLLFLKKKTEHQLILAVCCLFLSSLAVYALGISTNIRASFEMLLRGMLASVGIFILITLLTAALLYFRPSLIQHSLVKLHKHYASMTIFALIGAALCAAVLEELLFRAIPFSALSSYTFSDPLLWFVLLVHYCIMLGFYFMGRSHLLVSALKALECSIYALLYCHNRSLLLIAAAHGMMELSSGLLLRNEFCGNYIQNFKRHQKRTAANA